MASTKVMSRLTQVATRYPESLVLQSAGKCFQQRVLQRGFHASTWLRDEKKPSKEEDPVNFRLGLYQSTFDRIQRERADNERFARLRARNDTDKLGLTISLVLCMLLP